MQSREQEVDIAAKHSVQNREFLKLKAHIQQKILQKEPIDDKLFSLFLQCEAVYKQRQLEPQHAQRYSDQQTNKAYQEPRTYHYQNQTEPLPQQIKENTDYGDLYLSLSKFGDYQDHRSAETKPRQSKESPKIVGLSITDEDDEVQILLQLARYKTSQRLSDSEYQFLSHFIKKYNRENKKVEDHLLNLFSVNAARRKRAVGHPVQAQTAVPNRMQERLGKEGHKYQNYNYGGDDDQAKKQCQKARNGIGYGERTTNKNIYEDCSYDSVYQSVQAQQYVAQIAPTKCRKQQVAGQQQQTTVDYLCHSQNVPQQLALRTRRPVKEENQKHFNDNVEYELGSSDSQQANELIDFQESHQYGNVYEEQLYQQQVSIPIVPVTNRYEHHQKDDEDVSALQRLKYLQQRIEQSNKFNDVNQKQPELKIYQQPVKVQQYQVHKSPVVSPSKSLQNNRERLFVQQESYLQKLQELQLESLATTGQCKQSRKPHQQQVSQESVVAIQSQRYQVNLDNFQSQITARCISANKFITTYLDMKEMKHSRSPSSEVSLRMSQKRNLSASVNIPNEDIVQVKQILGLVLKSTEQRNKKLQKDLKGGYSKLKQNV